MLNNHHNRPGGLHCTDPGQPRPRGVSAALYQEGHCLVWELDHSAVLSQSVNCVSFEYGSILSFTWEHN